MNKNPKLQRVRDSEDSENQKIRDSHATHATQDSALATSVRTLQEAVELSLARPASDDWLFIYARALKAHEVTTGSPLGYQGLESAFSEWWRMAIDRKAVPPDADFDEFRLQFIDSFSKVRAPLGANPLEEAIKRADSNPSREAARYPSLKLKRLVSVCDHLQTLVGEAPFFLSAREAAKILGGMAPQHALKLVNGLIHDGFLLEVEKGKPGGRRATRFRFIRCDPKPNGIAAQTTQPATGLKPAGHLKGTPT